MDIFRVIELSAAGMSAQKSRMNVVAGNLANIGTTRTPDGGPFRRRNVIFRSVPIQEGFPLHSPGIQTVEVAGIKESNRKFRTVYDPGHPDANDIGYVSFPDINVMEETVDMLSAVRSYEANMTAFNASKAMIRRLLTLGREP